jgi:hypothetical protein
MTSNGYYNIKHEQCSDIYRKTCIWGVDENDHTRCCGRLLFTEMNAHYCKEHFLENIRMVFDEDIKDSELMKLYYEAQSSKMYTF